jgi:hypothetical protein
VHEPELSARAHSTCEPVVSPPPRPEITKPTNEQIDEAITLHQKAIAAADKQVDAIERHGGVEITGNVFSMLDHPPKTDDEVWFKENPQRSHRARMPFAGEEFPCGVNSLPECTSFILVRQIKPGTEDDS